MSEHENTGDGAHKGLEFDLGLTQTKTFKSTQGSTYHMIGKHAEGVIGIHNPGILMIPMANGISLLCVAIKVQFKGEHGCAETAVETLAAWDGYSRGSERASTAIVVPIGISTGMNTDEVRRMAQEAMAQAIHHIYVELESKSCTMVDKEAITNFARACIGEALPVFEFKQVEQTPVSYKKAKMLAHKLKTEYGVSGEKTPTAGGTVPGLPPEQEDYDPKEDD